MPSSPPICERGDIALCQLVRTTGDLLAWGELYQRHHQVALGVASYLARCDADAEDLMSEAFTRVLTALLHGGDPDIAFRAYLCQTVRRLAIDQVRHEAHFLDSCELATLQACSAEDPAFASVEQHRHPVACAFHALEPHWRLVLWYTAIEGYRPCELTETFSRNAIAIASLAWRARKALRNRYEDNLTSVDASGVQSA